MVSEFSVTVCDGFWILCNGLWWFVEASYIIIQAVIEKLHRPSLTVIDRFQKISLIVFHTFNPTGIALKAFASDDDWFELLFRLRYFEIIYDKVRDLFLISIFEDKEGIWQSSAGRDGTIKLKIERDGTTSLSRQFYTSRIEIEIEYVYSLQFCDIYQLLHI